MNPSRLLPPLVCPPALNRYSEDAAGVVFNIGESWSRDPDCHCNSRKRIVGFGGHSRFSRTMLEMGCFVVNACFPRPAARSGCRFGNVASGAGLLVGFDLYFSIEGESAGLSKQILFKKDARFKLASPVSRNN
jgi:hypothetical protein